MAKLKDPLLLIILLTSLALGASVLTRGHEWGDDFASYIMQAQSIVNGNMDEFVQRNTFTIFDSSAQIGPVAYPWGYPLVLTPVLLLKGVHELALKMPGLFFFLGFLVCFFLLIEPRLKRTESLLLVALFAFNPTLITFLDYIISDIPFLFAVFFALLLISRFDAKHGTWSHILVGTAIFMTFFLRTTGFILLGSYIAWQAALYFQQRTKWKEIARRSIIVVSTFILLWFISSLIFPNGQGAYFRQLMGFTFETFISRNIPGYFYLGAEFLGLTSDSPWIFIYYIVVIFFIIGAWTRRKTDQLLVIFFIFYFSAMVVWPEWQGVRFIFPITPIFIYLVFQGLKTAIEILPGAYRPAGKVINHTIWLVALGVFLFSSSYRAFTNLKDERDINGPFDMFSDEMFNYIKTETSPDSVIVFFKPRAMRLFTDRDSIMVLQCDHLTRGDYVVLHKNWEYSQILPGDIADCNTPLEPVFENRRFLVYEILE